MTSPQPSPAPIQFQPDLPNPTPRPDRGPLIQRLLLVAGAFCVLVAATVYLAVSWRTIGVTGQAGIALGVTALAAAATHLLVRRGLRASAEAFAAVSAGLLALDLAGAHHLNVAGVARLPWWTWLTLASAAVLVAAAALARLERLTTYRVVAVIATAVLPACGGLALYEEGSRPAASLVSGAALAVAAGLVALAVRVTRRDGIAGTTAAIAGAGWWTVAAGAAMVAATRAAEVWSEVIPALAMWLVTTAVLLELTHRVVAAGRHGDNRRVVVSVAAPLAAMPGPVIVAVAAANLGMIATVVLAAAAAACCARSNRGRSVPSPVAFGAAAVSVVLPFAVLSNGLGTDLTGAVTLIAVVAGLGVARHSRGPLRVAAVVASLGAALLGIAMISIERAEPALWWCSGWTAVAVVLIGLAAFAAPTPTSRTMLVTAGSAIAVFAVMAALINQAVGGDAAAAAISLVGTGAALVMFGSARHSRLAVGGGAAAVALAAIDLAGAQGVETVEAYTAPIAATLLVIGLLARTARPALSSWAWTAPALVVALLPSAVAALHDTGVVRLVATAGAALLVVLVGARLRLAAPLVLGAATEILLAISQLAPYAAGAPRWITFAVAGVVLLSLGVAFEKARRGARTAGRWYAALS